jgi:hypothetical protein
MPPRQCSKSQVGDEQQLTWPTATVWRTNERGDEPAFNKVTDSCGVTPGPKTHAGEARRPAGPCGNARKCAHNPTTFLAFQLSVRAALASGPNSALPASASETGDWRGPVC